MMSLRRFVELGYDEEEYNEYVEYEKSTRPVYNDDVDDGRWPGCASLYETHSLQEDDDESETD